MIKVFMDNQDFINRYMQKMSLKKKKSISKTSSTTLNMTLNHKHEPYSKNEEQYQTLFGDLLKEAIKQIK